MWWCVLVFGCLHLQATTSTVFAQPLHGTWGGLAPPRPQLTDADADDDSDYRMGRFRMMDESIPDISISNPAAAAAAPLQDLVDSPALYLPGTKRAFTLLSRWHPFSTLSRNAPSIREQNRQILNDLDIETRAMLRPVGQPLRWG